MGSLPCDSPWEPAEPSLRANRLLGCGRGVRGIGANLLRIPLQSMSQAAADAYEGSLPAGTIPLQHGRARPVPLGHRGEQDDALGQFQRGGLNRASLAGRLPADFRLRGHGPDHPGVPQWLHARYKIECLAIPSCQNQRATIHTHRHWPVGLHCIADPPARRIPPIRQDAIPRHDRELRQRLARARPLGQGQLEKVKRQRRQAHAVVDPTQRPVRPGLLHRRRVEHPHLESVRRRSRLQFS